MSNDSVARALFPPAVPPPLPEPVPIHVLWEQVEDVGHHEDAYYKLGWRCVSRHDGHALLCRYLGIDTPQALEFMIMIESPT